MAQPEQISVFDILKIGVGPSSSHTLGPWRAAQRFVAELKEGADLADVTAIQIDLYGSLAKTGKGHGTDKAVILSLIGEEPETVDTETIFQRIDHINLEKRLLFMGKYPLDFDPETHIRFHKQETLPFHPNGMRLTARLKNGDSFRETFYSIGGGFVVKEGETVNPKKSVNLPYPCNKPNDLLRQSYAKEKSIAELVWENEKMWRSPAEVRNDLLRIWEEMKHCVYRGCHTSGKLPGGLNISRRAPAIHQQLIGRADYHNPNEWLMKIMRGANDFQHVLKWVSCFALAINEENAAFGRVVTAPTNGAAGVIPAVLLYYLCFCLKDLDEEKVVHFLLVSGEIGSYYKKGATISAAMGGCQAEIGVSSSMAAAALTECLGGTVEQALMAAEIAMEHHLGMTCDPVGGLVQIPCIERNSMGAIKAITASHLALESDPSKAKVTLDDVIKTMWETAKDMNEKYKETSEGGLAIHIPVSLPEC